MSLALAYPEPVAMAEKPFKIELPDGERGRTEEEARRLDVLNGRLSKPPKPRGRLSAEKAREADLKEREALEHGPALKADARWAKAANDETARLAEGRGEDVARNPSGMLEITERDQLRKLLKAGKLTPDQEEAGRACIEYYALRQEGLGSQMGRIGGTAAPTYDNGAAVFYGLQRAKALQRISVIEREVAMQCAQEPNALVMLRWVCERGNTVHKFTGDGRAYERGVAALVMALNVADAVIRGR